MNPYDGRVVSNFIVQAPKGEDMTVYGDGKQTRSFQYIHDLVDGLIALMNSDESRPVNIGNGDEFTIGEFAELVREIVEKVQDKDASKITNGHVPTAEVSRAQTPQPAKEDPNAARVEKLKQRVTITKDGKKRVAPLLVSSAAGSTESTLPTSQLMSHSNQASKNDTPQTILDLSKPYDGLPKGGLASLLIGNKRKMAETGSEDDNFIRQRNESAERQGATSILMNTADGLTTATPALGQANGTNGFSMLNQSIMLSQIRLAIPTIRTFLIGKLRSMSFTAAVAFEMPYCQCGSKATTTLCPAIRPYS